MQQLAGESKDDRLAIPNACSLGFLIHQASPWNLQFSAEPTRFPDTRMTLAWSGSMSCTPDIHEQLA